MMMILEIAEGTEFDVMEPALQDAIMAAGIVWPESQLLGTSAIAGKVLILIDSKVDKDTLTALMNTDDFDEDGKQIAFNLGWTVLACEGETVNQAALLPYFDDVPTVGVDGEIIGYEPLTDLTGKLQIWSGRQWQY